MREQFDKKLVEKIKDSFLQNEEPFDPKEWEKFSRTYYGSMKKGYLSKWGIWIAGIAAALVISFFLIPERGTEEKSRLSQADTLSVKSQTSEVDGDLGAKKTNQNPDELKPNAANSDTQQVKTQESINRNTSIKVLSGKSTEVKPSLNLARLPDSEERNGTITHFESENGQVVDLGRKVESEINPAPLISILKDKESMSEPENAQKTINEWLADANPKLEEEKSGESFAKSFRLGVLLAPQSISNATQSLNFGGGLMTEFAFSKRLKLDVGLAYAKQNLTPTGGSNRGGYLAMDTQDRQANFSNNLLNASYELSFGQLEIPINLKYRVMEKNASAFYLITGLSNMVYLNQKNVGTFSAANFSNVGFMTAKPMVQTFTETTQPEGNMNNTDSGRLLNLSVGYEYNLSNGTFLSLEPFYKMSIGNQTFVNQQFSIGGINLRMNFQLKK
ncbi:outer membrane beta-barrel protein [Rhodonellum sp.]|uniref:outer membrane beta-barrel protein n=1 Tax=Rhodonellum sp. TaxID=2231180 RepID=UPI0027247611|nr:outer membrane beta-barrel protein [Rhodonellum sp.]MDO9552058.1 outer membrane beta-barrel protein [Rhodonellum sp.]